MSISSFRAAPAFALIPFGYLAATRLKSVRDVGFLVATSWLPAIWLIIRLGDFHPVSAALQFLAGYLAFIAIYELGYLINDMWDARRAGDGRKRFDHEISPLYVAVFAVIRLALWAVIAMRTGWIEMPVWLAGYAALIIALGQHNLARSKGLRLASFLELATLRFLLPILAAIPRAALWVAILIAVILYAYPRFLAYMDSKGILQLQERQQAGFGASQLAWLAPLLLFIAYATSTAVIAELLGYFILAYGAGTIGFGRAPPENASGDQNG